MGPHQRPAAVAAVALIVTMFLPWYGLQSVSHGAIESKTISAFGDVSFVEAAIFLVAAAVLVMLVARAEGRDFHLPGGDGSIVLIAGGWAALLIFYRVFSRPPGGGYPVSIEWGFFLAFVAAGALAYAGWRMRAGERPQPPLARRAQRRAAPDPEPPPVRRREDRAPRAGGAGPVAARRPRERPSEPLEQLSFEEEPTRPRLPPAPPARD